MRRLPKIFLIVSIAAFLVGFTEIGSDLGWGILKPISAISFIAFFITNALGKEIESFDREHEIRIAEADRQLKSARGATQTSPPPTQQNPRLVSAASR